MTDPQDDVERFEANANSLAHWRFQQVLSLLRDRKDIFAVVPIAFLGGFSLYPCLSPPF